VDDDVARPPYGGMIARFGVVFFCAFVAGAIDFKA